MKNSSAKSQKQAPAKNKSNVKAQKAQSGITVSWVIKNLVAVAIVLFLLNKLVIGMQPGYNWAYNMLKGNLEVTQHYAHTTTDQRFEMKLGLVFQKIHRFFQTAVAHRKPFSFGCNFIL